MAIRVHCPKCHKNHTLPNESRGQKVNCDCGKVFQAGSAPAKSSSDVKTKPSKPSEKQPSEKIVAISSHASRPRRSPLMLFGIAAAIVFLIVVGGAVAVGVMVLKDKLGLFASTSSSSSSESPSSSSSSSSRYIPGGNSSTEESSSSSSPSPSSSSPTSSVSSSTSGPQPGPKVVLTPDKFNKIDKGMTRDALVNVMGGPPTETKNEKLLDADQVLTWEGVDGTSSVIVLLLQGKVLSKVSKQGWPISYPSDTPQAVVLKPAGFLTQDKFNKIDKDMTANELTVLLTAPTEMQKLPAPATGSQSIWKGQDGVQFVITLSADGKVVSKAGPQAWAVVYPKDIPKPPEPTLVITTKGSGIGCVSMSSDGKTIATGNTDGGIQIWDPATGKERKAYEGPEAHVHVMALSGDGKLLVTDAKEQTELRTWVLANDKPGQQYAPGVNPVALAYMSTGSVAVASRITVKGKDDDYRLLTYEPTKKLSTTPINIGVGDDNAIRSIAASPDGRIVAIGLSGKRVRGFDMVLGKEVSKIEGYQGGVVAMAFSGDGKTIVTGSEDKFVITFDPVPYKQRLVCQGHTDTVTCVAYSPNGKYLASGATSLAGNKVPVKIWDAENGKELASFDAHEGKFVGVFFTSDNKQLVTVGDKTIKFWDLEALPNLKQLK